MVAEIHVPPPHTLEIHTHTYTHTQKRYQKRSIKGEKISKEIKNTDLGQEVAPNESTDDEESRVANPFACICFNAIIIYDLRLTSQKSYD